MAVTTVKVGDIGIYRNDVLVGCAQTASLTINKEMLDAACAATGPWRASTPGINSWEGSIDALWRAIPPADAATNVGPADVFTELTTGEKIEIRFGFIDGYTVAADGFQLAGMAFWTQLAMTAPMNGVPTWTAAFQGDGELELVEVPAA